MARSIALILFLALNAEAALALPVNWRERAARFTAYVERNAAAQGRRVRVLEGLSNDFQRRAQGYARALERSARPFQAAPDVPTK
jgi:precorrin-6B methylase 1